MLIRSSAPKNIMSSEILNLETFSLMTLTNSWRDEQVGVPAHKLTIPTEQFR